MTGVVAEGAVLAVVEVRSAEEASRPSSPGMPSAVDAYADNRAPEAHIISTLYSSADRAPATKVQRPAR